MKLKFKFYYDSMSYDVDLNEFSSMLNELFDKNEELQNEYLKECEISLEDDAYVGLIVTSGLRMTIIEGKIFQCIITKSNYDVIHLY